MLAGTYKKILKGVAIAQAITAPGLIVLGMATHNKKLTTIGVVWSGLIALDTGRTSCIAVDYTHKANGIEDNMQLF